ncbi:MAG: arginine repressor [Acidobacteria bacterium]|nr:arginine repressor [Acidobacteriota bacterium]
MPKNKPTLDQAILMLIERQEVPDQATLIALLAQEGFRTSQGTVSRRLTRLSVQKRHGRYQRVVPENHPLPPYRLTLSPPNLLVLKTGPDFAMALAVRIDRTGVEGVAGTLAGLDTLLVITNPGADLEIVRGRIVELLGPPA